MKKKKWNRVLAVFWVMAAVLSLLSGCSGKSEEKEIFNVALPDEIKSAMSEIELTDEALSGGNKLMNLSLPDNTLVVMVKRGEQYFVPKGHTHLQSGDRLLVISDNDEELRKSYESL